MSITHDPYLLRVTGDDLTDNRAVLVGGDVEQINRHSLDIEIESTPQPYQIAALVDWLAVCACLILIAIASVPELRAAIAGVSDHLRGKSCAKQSEPHGALSGASLPFNAVSTTYRTR